MWRVLWKFLFSINQTHRGSMLLPSATSRMKIKNKMKPLCETSEMRLSPVRSVTVEFDRVSWAVAFASLLFRCIKNSKWTQKKGSNWQVSDLYKDTAILPSASCFIFLLSAFFSADWAQSLDRWAATWFPVPCNNITSTPPVRFGCCCWGFYSFGMNCYFISAPVHEKGHKDF